MVLIDNFFFLIFTLTSLIYWAPVLLILFIPFMIARRLRRKGFYPRFVNEVYQKTVWWQRMEIIEAVPRRSRVLDIGCGNGYLAKIIAETREAEVICVDVDDFNQTDLPTILFDGARLPFADKEFDLVILSFVLHHSELPEELLKEASRVCKGKIVIYEDEAVIGAQKIMARAHEKIYNFLAGQRGKVTYHSPEGWKEIFDHHHLAVLAEKREWVIGSLIAPLKRDIFILKNKT